MANFGAFPPPSSKETILFPGPDGGFEWGGAAADPGRDSLRQRQRDPLVLSDGPDARRRTARAVARRAAVPDPLRVVPRPGPAGRRRPAACRRCSTSAPAARPRAGHEGRSSRAAAACRRSPGSPEASARRSSTSSSARARNRRAGRARIAGAGRARTEPPYAFAGFRRWFDREGYPAIKPPWGTLNAVDLNTGEIKWKVPLGEYPELTKRGIPPTGTENYGGPVVTAGGLIFIGATADETFRAFDKETGKMLWQAQTAVQRQRHAEHLHGRHGSTSSSPPAAASRAGPPAAPSSRSRCLIESRV